MTDSFVCLMHIEPKSLDPYPILKTFLETKDNFEVILKEKSIKALYLIYLSDAYNDKDWKQLKLNIVEICALQGLDEHLQYLSSHIDIYDYAKKGKFRAFRFAAANIHRDVYHLLLNCTPKNEYDFLTSYEYRIYFYVAKNGAFRMLKALLKKAGKAHTNKMIASHQFRGFKIAVEKKHTDIVNLLLQYPLSLKYLFENISLYAKELDVFMSFTLEELNNMPKGEEIPEEKKELITYLVYYLNQLIKEDPELKNKALIYLSSLVQTPVVNTFLREKLGR